MSERTSPRTVGILLFDGVELLDYAGPAEVFSVARPAEDDTNEHFLFSVVTIAENDLPIKPASGSQIVPDYTTDNHPPLDILVVPGGMGTRDDARRQRLVPWILKKDEATEIIASVCTGAFFLADAGLLRRATTHWRGMQWMKDRHPEVTLVTNRRFIDEGHVVSSAGISAGIDMALHIVERLHGEQTAAWTAHRMEYRWRRSGSTSK